MHLPDIIVLAVLLAGILFSIGRKKLTVPAALTGAALLPIRYLVPFYSCFGVNRGWASCEFSNKTLCQ
jgi:hypothetical protein